MGILWDKAGGTRLCPRETQRSQGKGVTLVDLATWGHIDPQRNHIPFFKNQTHNIFSREVLLNWLIDKDMIRGMTLELNESRWWTKLLKQSKLGRTKRKQVGEVKGSEAGCVLHSCSSRHT